MRRDSFPHWGSLLLAGVLSVALIACSNPDPKPAARPESDTARFMQVIAHADDDLIFMNPDLTAGIRAKKPTVAVYLTAGETDKPDANGYAAQRQAGTRSAYARMAGVPDRWRAELLHSDPDHGVELYTLDGRPEVQLVFVNLPEDNDPRANGGKHALTRLWQDTAEALKLHTLTPAGGQLPRSYEYTRGEVIDLLVELFRRFRPTVVRTQDPSPDPRYQRNWARFNDHPDHVMAARLTGEAVRAYQRSGRTAVELNYRNYNVAEAPVNLAPGQQRDKVETFGAYVPHDPEVSLGEPYDGWLRRQYQRWPTGTSWAGTDADGSLYAFAVRSGELTYWRRSGATWSGPTAVGGAVLNPGVSVAADAQGRLHVFARSRDSEDVVTTSPGSWTWTKLGSPNERVLPGQRGAVGTPVAAKDPGGALVVFVKNGGGGVSALSQSTSDGWPTVWLDLGGTDVQDGLSVGPGLTIAASTRTEVLRWKQQGAGFTAEPPVRAPRPAGPPVTGGGLLAYPVEGSGALAIAAGADPVVRQGTEGLTDLGLAVSGDLVTLYGRRPDGSLTVGVGRGANLTWSELRGPVLTQPAAVAGPDGVTLTAIGEDGRLLVSTAALGGSFPAWTAVG
ncbi:MULTISPECIES: PIG-L family deacetylase [unclassified Crossiella]|uniref:PIG-L family deacetylase n=1 Tax=unclassified Crossiella TaxID=2620835 RepID=UPI001FFF64AD|nr:MULTISPECIES: PIG-L family deacetylase [unclassified Crossiella]MCK2237525.1 PIG-L family deacetylase [Crossiella sp. S99.2]MCK2254811.1 PIG-L family deacetylase [Crossiella sp. S99.1]